VGTEPSSTLKEKEPRLPRVPDILPVTGFDETRSSVSVQFATADVTLHVPTVPLTLHDALLPRVRLPAHCVQTEALQELLLWVPSHDHDHGPVPVTAVAIPALHRFWEGVP